MNEFNLYTPWDLQDILRNFLLKQRKSLKKSRKALSEQTGIPAPTIRRFEDTGEISLRQFCVLWQALSDELAFIDFIGSLEKPQRMPKNILEAANGNF